MLPDKRAASHRQLRVVDESGEEVLGSHADISWGPDVLVSPDVLVVALEQARTLDWSRMRDLLLVAEILSPASARYDRFLKRRRYQEAGVPLYWIVAGDERQVEVWTPTDAFPRHERERLLWHPRQATEPFSLRVRFSTGVLSP